MRLINLKNISNWSEEKLIEECVNQNEKAQKHLFELYCDQMFAVCLRYFDHDEAYEVLNSAFMKVFKKLDKFKGEADLKWWIRRIVVNTALDFLRKNKTYKSHFVSAEEVSKFRLQQDDENDDISEFWNDALNIPKERLIIEINRLPKGTKVVFNLYALENYSHKQIAKELSITEATSRWHLASARKTLKVKVTEIVKNELENDRREKKY